MANNNLIPTNNIMRPFKFWCQATLPLVYDDSLSYYELLCKVVNQLNEVIKTVNNDQLAITELQNLYIELKNYVDNYFESTDFQAMINNKLDQMAQDGTLMNILGVYSIRMYDTTVEMLADTTLLLEGAKVRTLGYYTKNDNGGATFRITETESDLTFPLANGKYAEIILDTYVNPKQFGAKGDGVTDDTDNINKCLAVAKNIQFTYGNYLVDAVKSLNVFSDRHIDLGGATITAIKQLVNPLSYVFRCYQESNIIIENGFIEGDNLTSADFPQPNQAWKMGIAVMDCSHVLINNMTISNCLGDGIYIREYSDQKLTNYVTVTNCTLHNNQRNQIGYTGGAYITIEHCNILFDLDSSTLKENNFTGIDIEADHDYARFENFYINDVVITGEPNGRYYSITRI